MKECESNQLKMTKGKWGFDEDEVDQWGLT